MITMAINPYAPVYKIIIFCCQKKTYPFTQKHQTTGDVTGDNLLQKNVSLTSSRDKKLSKQGCSLFSI